MWNLALNKFIALSLFFLTAGTDLMAFSIVRDRANRLDPRHLAQRDEYIDDSLRTLGAYDLAKVSTFKARLLKELEEFTSTVYENELLERLVVYKKKWEKAHDKALEQQNPKKNKLLIGYSELLIPIMERIESQLALGIPDALIDPLVDEFVRAYTAYFDPNLKRTLWSMDAPMKTLGKHVFRPYHIPYPTKAKVEANNLLVSARLVESTSLCLGYKVEEGHFLEPNEVEALLSCNLDLSLFDPGISTLWRDPSTPWFSRNPADFPDPSVKIKFFKFTYRGVGSPKFRVKFKSEGVEHKLKIKLGNEVNSDLISSELGKLAGFNQDTMEYRPHMRVYLTKSSFQEFASLFRERFGIANFNRVIFAHGNECKPPKVDESGEKKAKCTDWFEIRDVQLESRPKEELRLGPISSYGWDYQNRREYRGRLLWFAWLGFQDTKSENHKGVLRRTESGWMPMHRFQDTGYSLGKGSFIQKPHDVFTITSKFKVNNFEPSIINRDSKGVDIWWNDYSNSGARFQTATWYDVKWMARKIAAITDEHIHEILRSSGMAPEVIDLYRHKLVMRRNGIVEAFGLQDEYPLFAVPNLDHFSPNDAVRNGKVVQTSFEGKNTLMVTQRGFWAALAELLNANVPLPDVEKNFEHQGHANISAQSQGLADFNVAAGVQKLSSVDQNFKSHFFGVGVSATISRRVGINYTLLSGKDKGRPFLVTDTLSISVEPNTGALSRWMTYLPLNFDASVKLYRKEIKLYHFAESIKEGFGKCYRLFKVLKNIPEFAAEELDELEVIKTSDTYGLQVDAQVGATLYSVVGNNVGVKAGAYRAAPVYISRDQFSVLHVYRENTKEVYGGAKINLAKPRFGGLSIPLIGLDFTANRFFHHGVDYTFKLPTYERNMTGAREQWQVHQDKKALKLFFEDPKSDEFAQAMHKNFEVISKGSAKKSSAQALFYFGKRKQTGKATTAVLLNNGKEHRFHYSYTDKRSVRGVEFSLPFVTNDLLVKKGLGTVIRSEIDELDPKNYVISATVEDFRRRHNLAKTLRFIDEINQRFSINSETPFYREFTLPPASVVDEYRKLYSVTRIYIKGHSVLEYTLAHKRREIKELAKMHFAYQPIKTHTALGSLDKRKRFLHTYKKLRAAIKKPASLARQTYLAEKLIARLHVEEHGIPFLQATIGNDNLFLTGDISGILRSFTPLQQIQDSSDYRFMAKSWGSYGAVPPIQKFLRYGHYVAPSIFIRPGIGEDMIFGSLEKNRPTAG